MHGGFGGLRIQNYVKSESVHKSYVCMSSNVFGYTAVFESWYYSESIDEPFTVTLFSACLLLAI